MWSPLLLSALLGSTSVQAVSSDVFSDIQKYTLFAAASYAETCPTPPSGSSIIRFFNNTATDTQAYLFRAGSELILSFRGSSSPKDLDTDFNFTLTGLTLPGTNCGGCLVHQGFQTAVASVLTDIQNTLGPNPGPLTLTGHSLGGGLAALASVVLKPTKIFTFGEPRNGNPTWGSYVESFVPASNYFRVTHYNDGVPQIPPTLLGFQHHGTEYFESLSTGNTADSTRQCSGSEPTDCNNAQNYGKNPINGAHIQYTDQIVAAMLRNPGCGFTDP